MSAYSDKGIADGAVAFWRLNETSGTTAVDIKGGNNGTISGGVTLNQPGGTSDGDKAMAFNGSTGTIVSSAMTIPAACTIEVWANTTASTPSVFLPFISTRVAGAGVLLSNLNNKFTVYVNEAGGQILASSPLINDGAWHHLVYVTDGAQTWLYIDGLQRVQQSLIHNAQTDVVRFARDTSTGYQAATIDDVAIYPTALTAAQIKAHYDATLTAGSPFLWFDEDEDPMPKYNIWTPITPSDTVDLPT